eukprot:g8304.t1
MAVACLRFQCIVTQAYVVSNTNTARVLPAAAAGPRALARTTMVKQSSIPSISRRACVPEGSASAPSAEPEVDQKHARVTAAAAGGGKGFGAKEVENPGQQKQQQQQQQQQRRRPKPSRPTQPKAPPRGNNLLVVGLGNPGDKYRMTRHNAGFLVAEELARRYGGTLKIKTAFQGEYCSVTVKGKSVGILRPITYMNNSGMSARKVMDFFKLPTNAAIVLVDEVALDFGQLRLKAKGGAGGHNGLKSLQAHLKTPEYTRLRIGVGASKFSEALSDHVLGEFTRTEKKELDNIIADACDAVEHWIEEEDMAKVMTRFNSPR